MKTKLVCALLSVLGVASLAMAKKTDFQDHLGIQMWSLRETAKESPLKALDLVKEYKLREVETAGFGDMTAEQYAAELKKRGLKAIGMHSGYEGFEKDLPGLIKSAKALGAKYIICPWLPQEKGKGFTDEQALKVAEDFNKWGKIAKESGVLLGIHPHGFEFLPSKKHEGKTVFDVLAENTDPETVVFEMDVFWVVHAGHDPVELLKKYGKRWALMHVKDIRKGAVTGLSTGGAPPTDNVPVGDGQVNWPAVLKTAQKVGTKHFLIEDETPAPLQCIPASLKYLRGLKL